MRQHRLLISSLLLVFCVNASSAKRLRDLNATFEILSGRDTPEYLDYLRAMEYTVSYTKNILGSQILWTVDIKKKGELVTIKDIKGPEHTDLTFFLGREQIKALEHGQKMKVYAEVDDNEQLTVNVVTMHGAWNSKQLYIFSNRKLLMHAEAKGKKAKLEYKIIR